MCVHKTATESLPALQKRGSGLEWFAGVSMLADAECGSAALGHDIQDQCHQFVF
jgi:hypothetical protein